MPSVDEALSVAREKENTICIACLDFDNAIARMRQILSLPQNKDLWSMSFVTRLQFLNKEHRRTVKNDLQALSTRLRQDYGQHDGDQDAKCRLDAQSQVAMGLFIDAEQLLAKCESLYALRIRQGGLEVLMRVLFSRAMPRLREGLQQASVQRNLLRKIMLEWGAYFQVLASEWELRKFLDKLQQSKFTKADLELKTTPVFERITVMCEERDNIVFESSRLGLLHETCWLQLGNRGVRDRVFRREIRRYDALAMRAQSQTTAQAVALKDAQDLTVLASSPFSLKGPGGTDIYLARFREAYEGFNSANSVCQSMTEVLRSLIDALHCHIYSLENISLDSTQEVVQEGDK